MGTELDQTTHRPEWRDVIAQVDAATPAALTYAANWDRFTEVPFWAQLDVIGIQAYFPLGKERPDREDLSRAWSERMAALRTVHQQTGKHIVFTELGYPRLPVAASAPWTHGDDPAWEELQLSLLDAALEAVAREPAVIGLFLWKWLPGERAPRDFSMQGSAQRAVIAQRWRSPEP